MPILPVEVAPEGAEDENDPPPPWPTAWGKISRQFQTPCGKNSRTWKSPIAPPVEPPKTYIPAPTPRRLGSTGVDDDDEGLEEEEEEDSSEDEEVDCPAELSFRLRSIPEV